MAFALAGDWPAETSPRLTALAEPLVHESTRPLENGDARLAPIAGALWLAHPDGRLCGLFGDEVIARLPPGGFRPAHDSDPVYITDTGEVGRWSPDAGWRPVWSAGLAGIELDAFGTADGTVLLSSSAWPDGMRLLDESRASIAWSLATVAPWMLALGRIAVGWRAGRVQAIEIDAGRPLWTRDGVGSPVALSEARAWVTDESGTLVELASDSGATIAQQPLPGGVPSFALTPGGRLYAVGRPLAAAVFDLTDGTKPIHRRAYPEVVTRGMPRVLAVTPENRLVIATAGAVVELRPGHDGTVREVWRTEQPIVDAQAGGERLAVITEREAGRRFLTVLGRRR